MPTILVSTPGILEAPTSYSTYLGTEQHEGRCLCFRRLGKNSRQSSVVILLNCYAALPDNVGDLDLTTRFKQMTVNDGIVVNRIGLSRKHIFDAVDASIARLGTYLDVLQIHRIDPDVSMEEIMKALNDVVNSGKARYIGASSMSAWEFQAMQNIAKQNGWYQFISMQDYHSLLYREGERKMIPYCKSTGVGLIPWSPLAKGLVARPFKSEATLRRSNDNFSDYLIGPTTEVDIKIIGRVEELAKKKGVSMAVIAIIWLLAKGVNSLFGLGSTQRVDEAVDGVKQAKAGHLTAEDLAYLDELYVAKPTQGR